MTILVIHIDHDQKDELDAQQHLEKMIKKAEESFSDGKVSGFWSWGDEEDDIIELTEKIIEQFQEESYEICSECEKKTEECNCYEPAEEES